MDLPFLFAWGSVFKSFSLTIVKRLIFAANVDLNLNSPARHVVPPSEQAVNFVMNAAVRLNPLHKESVYSVFGLIETNWFNGFHLVIFCYGLSTQF